MLLTQPARDRWSPLHLSQPVVAPIHRAPVESVVLDDAGHCPLDNPGQQQLQDAVHGFVTRHASA